MCAALQIQTFLSSDKYFQQYGVAFLASFIYFSKFGGNLAYFIAELTFQPHNHFLFMIMDIIYHFKALITGKFVYSQTFHCNSFFRQVLNFSSKFRLFFYIFSNIAPAIGPGGLKIETEMR